MVVAVCRRVAGQDSQASGLPSVVYRRRGYDYGILSLEGTA